MARKKDALGWVTISRKLMNDQDLWLSEPFTKGQAWVDLIMMAEWRNKGRYKVGTVYHSMLFLADRWGWSRGRVKRFLQKLESDTTIETTSDTTNGTTILLKNWGKYQGATDDTTNDTTNEAYHKNIYIRKKEKTRKGANADAAPSAEWKTSDPRVPEEYRADFSSFEEYDAWRNC